jgi:hypothetical protein
MLPLILSLLNFYRPLLPMKSIERSQAVKCDGSSCSAHLRWVPLLPSPSTRVTRLYLGHSQATRAFSRVVYCFSIPKWYLSFSSTKTNTRPVSRVFSHILTASIAYRLRPLATMLPADTYCDRCHLQFATPRQLHQHKIRNPPPGRHNYCPVGDCGHDFMTKDGLTRHTRQASHLSSIFVLTRLTIADARARTGAFLPWLPG